MEALSQGRVLLIAPSPPPYGGMAIQARLLEKLLRSDGVPVTFFASNLAFPAWLAPIGKVPGLRTMARTLIIWITLWRRVAQADVVHVLAASWVYFFAVVCPAVLYSRLLSKRVVLNYRGGDARVFFNRFGSIIRPIFHLAHEVTAPSEFLTGVIHDAFDVPVTIVPNILNKRVFTFRQRECFAPKILVTRHLELLYDVETAMNAFRLVQAKFPSASLWIAGSGSQETRLRALASEWRLDNVRFLGAVAHDDLGSIYDQCDILLNSSRVDNFPGALLEASGAGLAIVSTCAGGIPFVYKNGETALLVNIGDAAALAGAIETVIASPALGQSLTAKAALLAEKCDWKAVRQSLFKVYGFAGYQGTEAPAIAVNVSAGSAI